MADDIVTRLRSAAKSCNHGFPNGAGDSFPDPTYCGGCLRLNDAADEIERLCARLATADGLIEGLLDQHCQDADTVDDWWSNFITINAEAIRYMDSIGRCIAETNNSRVAYGRRQAKEARRG